MTAPWLSILIPVYNVRRYLDDCFQSVLSQIDSDVEIIALDDRSTDDSLQYLEQLAASTSHPIKILKHEKNSGISAARNTLISNANGEYVWFLDSDDAMHAGSIAALRKIVACHDPDMVICDYEVWRTDEHGNETNTYVKSFGGAVDQFITNIELLFQGLYKHGKFHLWSKISKRKLWKDDLQFPVGKYFEDLVIVPRLAKNVNSFYYSQCAWIRYRQREGSILATFSPQKVDDMVSAVEGIWSIWQQRIPDMSSRSRYFFIRYCVKIYLYAVKESKRTNTHFAISSPENRRRLFSSIGMGRKEMIKFYLLNGDIFRLIRILKLLA